jgi:hypothetical protein
MDGLQIWRREHARWSRVARVGMVILAGLLGAGLAIR